MSRRTFHRDPERGLWLPDRRVLPFAPRAPEWGIGGAVGPRRAVAAAGASYDTEVAADSPTAWWKLQDNITTGTLTDSSSGGTHGASIVSGPISNTTQMVTGDSFSALFVTSAHATFTTITCAGDFTLEGWINTPSLPGGAGYQCGLFGGGGAPIALWMYLDQFGLTFDGSNNIVQSATITTNTRYYVVVTRIGTAVTMYIDGSSVSTGTSASTFTFNDMVSTGIGSNPVNNLRVEQLAIYAGSGLSSGRVTAHWTAGQ